MRTHTAMIIFSIIAGYISDKTVDFLGIDQGIEFVVTLQVYTLFMLICRDGDCVNNFLCKLASKCKL